MRKRQWGKCIRPGCSALRLQGFPLCFDDFDQLPSPTREAWRATWPLGAADRRRAQERWQVAFQDHVARRIPLLDIRVPAWTPEPQKKKRGRAA